jgi:hypothetical protein
MMERQRIDFGAEVSQQLNKLYAEAKSAADKRYPRYIVLISFCSIMLLLFLIFLYEDFAFSAIFKLMLTLPLGLLIIVNLRYFHNRFTAGKALKIAEKLLTANGYDAWRIKSNECVKYSDSDCDYYLFNVDNKTQLLLRAQDFTIDNENFPNDNFVIPWYELFEITGNKIICEGKRIIPGENDRSIKKLLPEFKTYSRGQIMLFDSADWNKK